MKCDFTNREYPEVYLTRTSDNRPVRKDIYTKVSRELKKTFVTLKEIRQTETLFKEHKDLVDSLIDYTRRLAVKDLTSPTEELHQLMSLENDITVDLWKKESKTITREEHIALMQYILSLPRYREDLSKVEVDMDLKENELFWLKRKYLKDRNYCQEVVL